MLVEGQKDEPVRTSELLARVAPIVSTPGRRSCHQIKPIDKPPVAPGIFNMTQEEKDKAQAEAAGKLWNNT